VSRPWTFTTEDRREWAAFVATSVLVGGWAALGGGRRASESFYAIAAQILPVLILAVAVEETVHARWREWKAAYRLQVTGALLFAELAALIVIALGEEESDGYVVWSSRWLTDVLTWLTVVGLLVGFVAVVGRTLLGSAWVDWRTRHGAGATSPVPSADERDTGAK
jgi:hypothetical protein